MNDRFKILAGALALSLSAITVAAYAQKDGDSLVIKGSDTMVMMSSHWAEAFMDEHPDKNLSVTGGGSGGGIAALLNGTTDICNASRDMKPEEKQKAIDAGFQAVEINVALDGVAVVVNNDNPLTEVSFAQLKEMYTGKASNWSKFGGSDSNINLYSRETSSGTYVFFQEAVLEKADYAARVRMMPATSAIIEAVSGDKTGIGYVGLGFALSAKGRVKILKIKKDDAATGILPTEESVKSKEYPLARPLHCYTRNKPTGLVKEFLDFCLSPKGQAIAKEEGFVELP